MRWLVLWWFDREYIFHTLTSKFRYILYLNFDVKRLWNTTNNIHNKPVFCSVSGVDLLFCWNVTKYFTGPSCVWNETRAWPDTLGIPPNLGKGYVTIKPWFTPTHSKPSFASNEVTYILSLLMFCMRPSMSKYKKRVYQIREVFVNN